MKKIILYITILLLSFIKVASSQVASIQTVDGSFAGTTQVNVNLSDFTSANSIGAITMKIGFDPNVASFVGISNDLITSGINANVVGNEIIIAWSNVPAVSLNGTGFKLNFIYTGGNCNLSFNEGCEIADASGTIIQTTYLDGAIHQPSINTAATISNQQGDYNVVNELPIAFTNFPTSPSLSLVGSISFHFSYDINKLKFLGIWLIRCNC